jgi:hypothetical protein
VRWLLIPVLALLPACGGDSEGENEPEGRAGSPGAGGSAGSASGGAAGNPSAGAGSGTGGAGAPDPDCGGGFGAPSPVLTGAGIEVGSLALSPDELELIYTRSSPVEGADSDFRRSVRASKNVAFAPGEPLSVLNAACGDPQLLRSGDLSTDGLRFYFVCYAAGGDVLTPLRVARRATLASAFIVDAKSYGMVRSGPTLSWNELELYTSPSVSQLMGTNLHVRSSVSEAFDPGSTLSGFDSVFTPDLSSDDLLLFGVTVPATDPRALVMAERASTSSQFTSHSPLLTAPDLMTSFGSPTISYDCRSLYYVHITTSESTVVVMKR